MLFSPKNLVITEGHPESVVGYHVILRDAGDDSQLKASNYDKNPVGNVTDIPVGSNGFFDAVAGPFPRSVYFEVQELATNGPNGPVQRVPGNFDLIELADGAEGFQVIT